MMFQLCVSELLLYSEKNYMSFQGMKMMMLSGAHLVQRALQYGLLLLVDNKAAITCIMVS